MAVITDIVRQKNNPKRYSIYIDDAFFVGASDYIIVKYKLKKGMKIDKTQMSQACFEDAVEKAKSYVLRYHLSKSEKGITDKLREKGYENTVIAAVMEFLQIHRLTDDQKHAQLYTEQALNKKYGKHKIKAKLQQKGINAADIQKALDNITFEEERDAAKRIVQAKVNAIYKKSTNPYEVKQRVARLLMGKGFSHDVIQAILSDSTLFQADENGWDD